MKAFSAQRTMLALIRLAAAIAIVGGCTIPTQKYSASTENVETIKNLNSGQMRKISVGDFTAVEPGKNSIFCRAVGPVETPSRKSFENFIKEALIAELKFAGVYSAEVGMQLNGRLEKIDFDSSIGTSSWIIVMEISTPGNSSFRVESVHNFPGRFFGSPACYVIAQEFVPAVHLFIRKLFNDSNFQKILTPN